MAANGGGEVLTRQWPLMIALHPAGVELCTTYDWHWYHGAWCICWTSLFTPNFVLHVTSHVYAYTSAGFFEKKEYYTSLSHRQGGRLHLYLAANVAPWDTMLDLTEVSGTLLTVSRLKQLKRWCACDVTTPADFFNIAFSCFYPSLIWKC